MNNKIIICLVCSLLFLMSFGKDPLKISMNVFLSTAKTDAKLTYNQQTQIFIKNLNYNLPLLQKLEFKVGADNFDLTGQQYGIALSPNTLRQIKQQKAIKIAELNKKEAENTVFIHQALVERYQILTDIRYAMVLKEKENTLEVLLTQKKEALKSLIQQGIDVRVKDIADTENDRYNVQLDLLELENNLSSIHEKVRQLLGADKEVLVSFEHIVDVKDIEKVVNTLKKDLNSLTPDMLFAKSETDAIVAAVDLENASNKEILSSVQLVAAPKKTEFFNDFGVRFTLAVPLTGNTRLKRNELAIDLKKAQNKESLLYINNKKTIQYQLVSIENLIKKYRIYADKAENSLIKSLLNNTRLTTEMNATELLDLKLTQQKTEVDLAKIQYAITQHYIDLLNNTNLLVALPLKNYLSAGLETF